MDVIEQARVEDAQDVAELYLLARRESLGAIPPVVGSDERVLTWLANRIRNGEDCWITRDESGISAFMLLETGWLDQLYVRPDRIGQGLGARLVDKAKDLMPNGMKLWTFQSNVRAHKFYEQHGFVVIEKTDGRHNEEQSPDVCYEWQPKGK